MSLPPNIRVNARVPFPSSVQGAAFISVSKANGLWTITPNFRTLQGGTPSANYLVAVQDKNTGQFASIPSTSFVGASGTGDGNVHFDNYAGAAPLAAVGLNGDYAVDVTNGRGYGPKAAGAWPATPAFAVWPRRTASATAPTSPFPGDQWFDTTNNVLVQWTDVGSGPVWFAV
jgi:hypothetical protein